MENKKERIFNVEHLADVRDLMKLGHKPVDVFLSDSNYIRFVFKGEETFQVYKNIKAKRQEHSIRKTTK